MSIYNQFSRFEALASALPLTSGKVFFVADSADAWFERLQRMFPVDVDGEVRLFSNLNSAVVACTGSRGDVIVVFPNYTFTVSVAAGLLLDKAGVTILGLGYGANRPTLDFTTATTADVEVDAASVTIDNFEITASFDALAGMFDVDANYFTLKNSRILFTSGTTIQATKVILCDSTNVANSLLVDNCQFIGDTTAGNVSCVELNGGSYHTIRNSTFWGNFDTTSGGAILNNGDAATQILIDNCLIQNMAATSQMAVRLVAGTTGAIKNSQLSITLDTNSGSANYCIGTPGGLRIFESYCSTDSGEFGGSFGGTNSGSVTT